MVEEVKFMMNAVLIGIGATIVMDLWSLFQRYTFGVPSLNYAMVGRWVGHLARGRFAHDNIAKTTPVHGELIIGWSTHYITGVIFACVLLSIWGMDWAYHPTLFPALISGAVSVVAPFFILQPAIGAGIAASKTPNPTLARLRSFLAHISFGIGLYVSAMLATMVIQP